MEFAVFDAGGISPTEATGRMIESPAKHAQLLTENYLENI
jgi:hypothetical protein